MITASAVCLGVAAGLGLYMAVTRLAPNMPAKGVAITHGIFALVGVALLLAGTYRGPTSPWLRTAAAFLVLAAIGGLVMFHKHSTHRKFIVPLMIIHGLLAIAGIAMLVVGIAIAATAI